MKMPHRDENDWQRWKAKQPGVYKIKTITEKSQKNNNTFFGTLL